MKKLSALIYNSSKGIPKAKLTKNASILIAREIVDNFNRELAENGKFALQGVGSFKVKHVGEKTRTLAIGPKKGEQITISARNQVRFRAASRLKSSVQTYQIKSDDN